MKSRTLLTKLICSMVIVFGAQQYNAATYTAIANGDWDDGSIWDQGTPPPAVITGDDIIIPAGIIVNFNQDTEINSLVASLEVEGELTSLTSNSLTILSGSLLGSGVINMNTLFLDVLSTVTFTGTATFDKVLNNNVALELNSTLTIQDSLILIGGEFSLGTNSNLIIGQDAVINIEDGSLILGDGLFTANNDYHVLYEGVSKPMSAEVSGSGLTDVLINLDPNEVLELDTNIVINGDVILTSGNFDLSGYETDVYGEFTFDNGAYLMGDSMTVLTLIAQNYTEDSIFFEAGTEINMLSIQSVNGSEIYLMTDLKLENELAVANSSLIMEPNTVLTLEDEGTIRMSNGELDSNLDILTLGIYSVIYEGTSQETSMELEQVGLANLTVNLAEATDSLQVNPNLVIDGYLNVNKGLMNISNKSLTLNNEFNSTNNGRFRTSPSTDIIISPNSNIADTMLFEENSMMNSLTLDGNNDLMIGSDVEMNTITLVNGRIVLMDANLKVSSGGLITGYDNDSYIATDSAGMLTLMMDLNVDTYFPIGTRLSYAPAEIRINNGTPGYFSIHSFDEVRMYGTEGEDLSISEPMVKRTWVLSEMTGSSSDIDLKLMWRDMAEVNGFNDMDCYIARYHNFAWDWSQNTAASTTPAGLNYLERTDITGGGAFVVTDSQAALDITEGSLDLKVFPNPVQDRLFIESEQDLSSVQIDITDLTGALKHRVNNLNGNNIDVSSLPTGIYFIKISNENGGNVIKFIKK